MTVSKVPNSQSWTLWISTASSPKNECAKHDVWASRVQNCLKCGWRVKTEGERTTWAFAFRSTLFSLRSIPYPKWPRQISSRFLPLCNHFSRFLLLPIEWNMILPFSYFCQGDKLVERARRATFFTILHLEQYFQPRKSSSASQQPRFYPKLTKTLLQCSPPAAK